MLDALKVSYAMPKVLRLSTTEILRQDLAEGCVVCRERFIESTVDCLELQPVGDCGFKFFELTRFSRKVSL